MLQPEWIETILYVFAVGVIMSAGALYIILRVFEYEIKPKAEPPGRSQEFYNLKRLFLAAKDFYIVIESSSPARQALRALLGDEYDQTRSRLLSALVDERLRRRVEYDEIYAWELEEEEPVKDEADLILSRIFSRVRAVALWFVDCPDLYRSTLEQYEVLHTPEPGVVEYAGLRLIMADASENRKPPEFCIEPGVYVENSDGSGYRLL